MKAFFINLITNVVFLSILLLSAWRLDYPPAWAYFAVGIVSNLALRVILANRPALARERVNPGAGAEAWDKRLLGIGFLMTLYMLVAAGLDSGRFDWGPETDWLWSAIGLGLTIAGSALFLRSMAENRFFTAVVRVQRDEGQVVCDTGPYSIVRHPGYAGMIIGTLGFPLLFMSASSTLPAAASIALLVVRTQHEDKLLKQELEGYVDYSRRVRFRLVPGVW